MTANKSIGSGLKCFSCTFYLLLHVVSCIAIYDLRAFGQGPELIVQSGHNDSVGGLAITPDRRWLISGSDDFSVQLWDLSSGREERVLGQHAREVKSLAVCPNSQCVVSGGNDQVLKLWELPGGRLLRTFVGHTASVDNAVITPDGRIMISAGGDVPPYENRKPDFSIRIWDMRSGRELHKLMGHQARVISIDLSPDGHLLATGSADGTIRIWDLSQMIALRVISGFKGEVSAKFSPAGHLLASAMDHKIQLWDLSTGLSVREFTCYCRSDILVFGFKGDWLAYADADTVHVLDLQSGQEIAHFPVTRNVVQSVLASSDNRSLFVGYRDGSIIEWNLAKAGKEREFGGHTAGIDTVSMSPNGHWLASGHRDSTIKLWDAVSGALAYTFKSENPRIWTLTFSKDDRWLAASGQEPEWDWLTGVFNKERSVNRPVEVWDLRSRQRIFRFVHDATTKVEFLSFSPDGRWLASCGGGTVQIWDLATGKKVRTLSPAAKVVLFAHNGHWVATGARDSTLTYWELPSGRVLRRLSNVGWASAASSDGRWLASMGWLNDFRAWDLKELLSSTQATLSGNLSRESRVVKQGRIFRGHKEFVTDVAFRPNSGEIASSSWDGQIKLWDLNSGRELYTLKGHLSGVQCLTFNEDGRWLISGGWDGAIRIWDMANRKESISLFAMRDSADWLTVAPDGLFDGTADAMQQVAWRRAVGLIVPLDNFFTDFYRPGLLSDVLSSRHPQAQVDIATALQVPGLRVMLAQKQAHIEIRGSSVIVCFHQIPGVAVRTAANGQDLPVEIGAYSVKPNDPTCKYQKELQSDGTTSEFVTKLQNWKPEIFTTPWDGRRSATVHSTLHVFTVGIGHYPTESGFDPILYAANSAKLVENFFNQESTGKSSYSNIRVWPGLYDQGATRKAIRQQLGEMSKVVGEDDIVLLYFAGHGTVWGEEMFYFASFDAHEREIFRTGLSTAMLAEALRSLPAKRIVLIIDACQSGGAVEALSKIGEAKARVQNQHKDTRVGVHVIAATMPLSYAVGRDQSVLAGALLRAFTQKNRSITALQMIKYLQESLPAESEKAMGFRQVPLTSSIGADFSLL